MVDVAGLRVGFARGENCDRGRCHSQSYDEVIAGFEREGSGDILPTEFRTLARDGKMTLIVGLLLIGASGGFLLLRQKRSVHVRHVAIATIGLASVFLLLVLKTLVSGHGIQRDNSMSYGPVLAMVSSALLLRTAVRLGLRSGVSEPIR